MNNFGNQLPTDVKELQELLSHATSFHYGVNGQVVVSHATSFHYGVDGQVIDGPSKWIVIDRRHKGQAQFFETMKEAIAFAKEQARAS